MAWFFDLSPVLQGLLATLFTWFVTALGASVINPATEKLITPVNLLSVHGLHFMLTKTVSNFTGFAPLGIVLTALMGLGVAEQSGFISTAVRKLVMSTPRKFVTASIFLAAILMHTASDAGYVVLIPLGGVIFLAIGRHPLAGLAAAFAGVSGGFCANFLLGSGDVMLAAISQEAARILPQFAHYEVTPMANYYFMFVSGFLIIAVGTWVTERFVIPLLGEYKGEEKPEKLERLTHAEYRGLKWALISIGILAGIVLLGMLPENGFLRAVNGGSVLQSPFLRGIVPFIFLTGVTCGVVYGFAAGTFKNTDDIIKAMSKTMGTMGGYIVLAFFAAQFIELFKESNLGTMIAIVGADVFKGVGLKGSPLMVGFIGLTIVINFFIGSAAAKWALMAPIFVPMFMLLGYTPEAVQTAYRIGDAPTNVIAPLLPYMPLVIAYFQKYDKKAGIGTIIATMLPFAVAFTIAWIIMLIIWMQLGLPFGPGAVLHLP